MNTLCTLCGTRLVETPGHPLSCPACTPTDHAPGVAIEVLGTEILDVAGLPAGGLETEALPGMSPHPNTPGTATEGLATEALVHQALPSLAGGPPTDLLDIRASINVRHMRPAEAAEWEQTFAKIADLAQHTRRNITESLPGLQTGRDQGPSTTVLPSHDLQP
ncbi:MAG: hypothetical protein NT069_15860, partial [Planctomycetota bacterium]|nr:hypothetical protein [Planctomycetota bacterium]